MSLPQHLKVNGFREANRARKCEMASMVRVSIAGTAPRTHNGAEREDGRAEQRGAGSFEEINDLARIGRLRHESELACASSIL